MKHWALIPGLVFLAGLVLPVWALFTEPRVGLPGLDAFPSAYLGDTVLIPLSVLLIVKAARFRAPVSGERKIAWSVACAAAVMAGVVQASWLHDRHPRMNWTLPRPGQFTLAGWWHAAYFVVLSALFAGVVTLLLLRVAGERRNGVRLSVGPWTPVFFIATGTYLALVVHDSTGGDVGWAAGSSLTLAGVGVLAAVVVTGLVLGRFLPILLRPALVGLVGAWSVTALTVGPGPSDLRFTTSAAVVISAAALALVYHMVSTEDPPVGVVDRAIGVLTMVGFCSAAWLTLSHKIARHDSAGALVASGTAVLLLFLLMIGVLGRRAIGALLSTACSTCAHVSR